MPEVTAYAADSQLAQFHRTTITRREPGPTEVFFDVKYAGICHSDIHTVRQEWGPVNYPIVPGHEIAGIVSKIGSKVTKFKVGDRVGVGCFVDSCGKCESCTNGDEQFCSGTPGAVFTYASTGRDGLPTAGGYSTGITVEQDYICKIPDALPLDAAAPLLCAGITTYAPLKRWGVGPGMKVAVVGLGGLGHMGVQIASAMGAEVHVISQTRSKEADALKFGAVALHPTSEDPTLAGVRGQFDFVLSTLSDGLPLDVLTSCLKTGGVLVIVGLPEKPAELHLGGIVGGQKVIAGSMIGGIAATQEMLDFCAEHNIAAQVEVISGEEITAAYDKVVGSKVRYRYVIDTSTFDA